jgi:hypothetical protein
MFSLMNHTLHSFKWLACFPIKVFMYVSSHPRMIYRMSRLSPYNLTSVSSPESVRWRRLTAIYASVRIRNLERDGWPQCSGATWPKHCNHKRQTKQILTPGTNILYRNQLRCPACGVLPKATIWFPNKPRVNLNYRSAVIWLYYCFYTFYAQFFLQPRILHYR